MNAIALRHKEFDMSKYTTLPKSNITIILDNVLDTFNIGSIFRLADAIAANEVILTGNCALPNNKQIKKSSMFLSEVIPWSYHASAANAIRARKPFLGQVVALELGHGAKSPSEVKFERSRGIGIVLGNESTGVSQEALDMANVMIKLPMKGLNNSLNVAMSLAMFAPYVLGEI